MRTYCLTWLTWGRNSPQGWTPWTFSCLTNLAVMQASANLSREKRGMIMKNRLDKDGKVGGLVLKGEEGEKEGSRGRVAEGDTS